MSNVQPMYTESAEDRLDTLLRAVNHMTSVALIGEAGDGSEDDLRSLCACIAAQGLRAQQEAKA